MEQEYIYRAQNIVHNYYNQTVFIELGFFLIRLELMWNRNVCIHLFAIYLLYIFIILSRLNTK